MNKFTKECMETFFLMLLISAVFAFLIAKVVDKPFWMRNLPAQTLSEACPLREHLVLVEWKVTRPETLREYCGARRGCLGPLIDGKPGRIVSVFLLGDEAQQNANRMRFEQWGCLAGKGI